MKRISIVLALFSAVILAGCVSATATRTSKDGTISSIKVRGFLESIQNGRYTVTNADGTSESLSTDESTPDQQSIALLAAGVVDLGKSAMLFGSKAATNAAPAGAGTNAPTK